jgi:transposase
MDILVDNKTLFPKEKCSSSPPEEEKEKKKPRFRKVDRRQMVFHPVEIDRLIPDDHEARAIWELVGALDLSCYYDQVDAREGTAGAPAFDPRLLVSIWVYSYSKGISSSREIARLSEYDPAYQWLTGMRPVNYHTVSDFRTAHKDSLHTLFVEVLAMLTAEGMVTMEQVMHDGTKIKASAGKDTFRGEVSLREHLMRAEAHVKAMEEASEEEIAPGIQKARERAPGNGRNASLMRLTNSKRSKLKKKGSHTQASITDPECRFMSQSDRGLAQSYNVQISTDAHEKAIIAVSLSQSPADQILLPSALDEMERTAGIPNQVVVDAGFATREAIIAAHERGIDLIGSFPESKAGKMSTLARTGISEAFYPEHFLFDQEHNIYICPEGKRLDPNGKTVYTGKTVFRYKGKECSLCPSKPCCCPTSKRRSITRTENDLTVVAFLAKMQTAEAKAIYRQRAEVAEFPNAWIKEKFGLRQFRLRGLIKAGMEALWACLTYNIKLWIRLCWKPRHTAAVT